MNKKKITKDSESPDNLREKLDELIEQSKAENEALKKILKGLENINQKKVSKKSKSSK